MIVRRFLLWARTAPAEARAAGAGALARAYLQSGMTDEDLAKGKQLYIEGRLQTRKWQDKTGADRYSTEIVAEVVRFLGGGGEGRSESPRSESRPSTPRNDAPPMDDDSEIPF